MEIHDYRASTCRGVWTNGAKTQRMLPRLHAPILDLSVWLVDGAGLGPQQRIARLSGSKSVDRGRALGSEFLQHVLNHVVQNRSIFARRLASAHIGFTLMRTDNHQRALTDRFVL